MKTNLDIAAVLGAISWPITLLIIFLAYRKKIPTLVEGLVSRVTKLEFAGISLELAKAKPFVPEWSNSSSALDLRQKATSMQVSDSTARSFLTQLMEDGSADYAEINLGTGKEWLTSRLFIMSVLFARMKSIKCFVFVENTDGIRKRYVGWAEPSKIRWALARRYPWLEQGYAMAYSTLISQQNAVIVSNQGRLGSHYDLRDPGVSINLLSDFLQRVQITHPPLPPFEQDEQEWVLLDKVTNTYEHAQWLTPELLENILNGDCHTSTIRSTENTSRNKQEQLATLLAVPEQFVAVVSDNRRFEYLVDRDVLLEQVAKRVSSETDSRS